MAHGEINHVEFPADDPERAKAFYGAVAGWEFGEMPDFPDYYLFRTSEGYGGAIGKRDVSTGHILRIYIEVASMDDALAAAERTGGTDRRNGEGAQAGDPGHGLVRGRHRSGGQRSGPLPEQPRSLTADLVDRR